MQLIDCYVYAVMKYLPVELREDIGKELRANIEDMLPQEYTEDEVKQVLISLGSPSKLAGEYNPKKRYLIGPSLYDKYVSTLKIVTGISAVVVAGIALLVWIVQTSTQGFMISNITKLIQTLISSGIGGAFQAVFWVTAVFIILERSGIEEGQVPFLNKQWTPDDLPEMNHDNKRRISRGETIFSMFATILFTALIYFQPQLIAFYMLGENESISFTPLFNIDRLQQLYMPIILILALIQLGMFVWKLIIESWNVPLAIINAIYNIVTSILVVIMFNDTSLLNTEFIPIIADYANISATDITSWATSGKWIFILIFVGICIGDSIVTLIKSLYKPRS